MFQSSSSDAAAPTVSAGNDRYDPQFDSARHMVFGSLSAVQATIKLLHKLNYAEQNDWSKPIPTGSTTKWWLCSTSGCG